MKPAILSTTLVALVAQPSLGQTRSARAMPTSAPVNAPSPPPAPAPAPPPATPAALAKAYAFAVRSGDSLGVQRLVHPSALACLAGPNTEFLGAIVSKDLKRRDQVLGDYSLSVDTVDEYNAPVPDSLFRFAVAPTQRLRLEFNDENGSGITIVRDVAPSGAGFLMAVPCPTRAGLAAFRAQRAAIAAEVLRTRKLLAELPDSLRWQLTDLLRHGKTTAAISRYRAATGSDSTVATRVIGSLGGVLR